MVDSKYINELPVGDIAGQINLSLSKNPRLVVTAPPGSGKSTLLPLTILDGLTDGKIIILEPRRAAARQIAIRMARMLEEPVGKTVGYRMRFESKSSADTRILVVTEGIMERMLIDDPTLDDVSAVIFDEFHERSLTSDLCLALTLAAQNILRPDLKVLIMSATIDTDYICNALRAPLIKAEGTLYDVDIIYGKGIDSLNSVARDVAACISRAYNSQQGNILAFLPGQSEILKCKELVSEAFPGAEVLPLYGQLSAEKQRQAIEFNPDGRRKIILATPISETSLTIQGVTAVVDSGLYRTVRYNPSTGLSRLVTDKISLDMARQRAGRAGRLSNGVCYRLWSKGEEHLMKANRAPEILEADLSPMVLEIAVWGCSEPNSLPWITPPPAGHISEARRLLYSLGALDSTGKVTPHGVRMCSLPCHPRIANMLISAQNDKQRSLAADVAAILEERDLLNSDDDADINSRIELLRQGRLNGDVKWKRLVQVSAQYSRMVGCKEDNTPANPYETGALIALAYPERIAQRQPDGSYKLANGERALLSDSNCLYGEDYLVVASLDKKIFLASPINMAALDAIAADFKNISWDSRDKKIVSRIERRIGSLIISQHQLDNPDRQLILKAIAAAAVKDGLSMFNFDRNVTELQNRIATVSSWHPETNIPDVSTHALLDSVLEWLPLYIGTETTAQALRKIDICQVIWGRIGYENQMAIERLAPTQILLPSGKRAKIQYRPDAPAPVVSARLQNCFGMFETPRIDDGGRPVLMELLSPGFKPVQLTQDMQGFWSNTYFEVRKELRRRYPKHRWPENPLEKL